MPHFTDEQLDEMAGYGGPGGNSNVARSLLSDLQSARSRVRELEALLAEPLVAEKVRLIKLAQLEERQAAERQALKERLTAEMLP